MRQLSEHAEGSIIVQDLLNKLADFNTTPVDYAQSFYHLGEILSDIIKKKFDISNSKITIACSSEDADWLSKGILDHTQNAHTSLAVFWNLRVNPFDKKDITIAPIIKSYIEPTDRIDYLIICKSIISTSCVIRTNLTYLIEKTQPKKIIIASPVLFADAISNLSKEFSSDISSRFEFLYFATDNQLNEADEVVPGIGGSVYKRLGLEDQFKKNKYIPDIVRKRRASMK
ncbi:hypothetical protein SAMN05518672_101747 [Chitinophaga sp. CF118]|uniref:hypothetical protein n=1 Tax=Chitinophaga sp. CF118 TaxID=1884367 RepID=UPI0008EAD150|nr:hypothetical protein [Chitinophaga sp. CF118]SFD14980.1 hypothetical protein SAMN05518672_101747 [Chitinophaga sp. CF118]